MSFHLHPPGQSLRVVLLDIDGTLIDSNDAHAKAWVGSLAEHGYVVAFDDVRPLIGMGGDKLLPALTGLDPDSGEAKRIGESRVALFREMLPGLSATPGARDLLELLRDKGLQMVVATSAKAEEVNALLEQAGVLDLVNDAASASDAGASKPDPDIVQAALEKAGASPSHSVLVGDTPYDIEAGNRARVPTIALRCGGWWPDSALADAIGIYDNPGALASSLRS